MSQDCSQQGEACPWLGSDSSSKVLAGEPPGCEFRTKALVDRGRCDRGLAAICHSAIAYVAKRCYCQIHVYNLCNRFRSEPCAKLA